MLYYELRTSDRTSYEVVKLLWIFSNQHELLEKLYTYRNIPWLTVFCFEWPATENSLLSTETTVVYQQIKLSFTYRTHLLTFTWWSINWKLIKRSTRAMKCQYTFQSRFRYVHKVNMKIVFAAYKWQGVATIDQSKAAELWQWNETVWSEIRPSGILKH